MRWFETPNFDFNGARKVAYIFSAILFLASLGAILTKGLQYGIDFKGGKEFVLDFENPVSVVDMRSDLSEPLGATPELKLFGSESEILIRTDNELPISEVQQIITSSMTELYPDNPFTVIKTDVVGPRFAEDLKSGALQAIIYAIVIIFIYILIRFRNWTFSAGAVAALIHDVVIVLGVFTLMSDLVPFSLQVDQAIIAAFLTIVGYSLNDTVVVFDRIRENSNVHKGMEFMPMVNKSLNDTLSRTVITSITTLFVVTVLFIFGGEVLKGFSFALLIGIVLGTYSSLFVASSLVVELEARTKKS
ncbi:MAG: protein translocase subunit SecF [Gracilimonas sp.]|uniref:protein translocase subunit SecF n=1 Tax=Gracilimonas TaxID=649462 RepID=UPI001AFFAB67|nr:protein translocase subunit SecF [Gracilimonas sp.]MBO6585740.1 protein translocase subunit SecF [Gracilimonas sp.]MBO6616737.1 protein translocase subunit SecF [Gracilimonas sp.]